VSSLVKELIVICSKFISCSIAEISTTSHGFRVGRSGGPESDELVAKARSNPRQMTQQEWKEILGPKTYEVARNKGTERPFTSPLYDNHKQGLDLYRLKIFNETFLMILFLCESLLKAKSNV